MGLQVDTIAHFPCSCLRFEREYRSDDFSANKCNVRRTEGLEHMLAASCAVFMVIRLEFCAAKTGQTDVRTP